MNLDELLYENVDLSTDDGVNVVREKINNLNVSRKQNNSFNIVSAGSKLFSGGYKQSIGEFVGSAK